MLWVVYQNSALQLSEVKLQLTGVLEFGSSHGLHSLIIIVN